MEKEWQVEALSEWEDLDYEVRKNAVKELMYWQYNYTHSFNNIIFLLFEKSDPTNKDRLREGFNVFYLAYKMWEKAGNNGDDLFEEYGFKPRELRKDEHYVISKEFGKRFLIGAEKLFISGAYYILDEFSTWKDGERYIGCRGTNIKTVLKNLLDEFKCKGIDRKLAERDLGLDKKLVEQDRGPDKTLAKGDPKLKRYTF